ncbi:polyketide synthase module [Aspergillus alliaceus]|uniref:polyketide synthase module n=1 Tax=Petromyces alliaceus TaxID=209559 RepID=UPI0012A46F00|nr:polyketide synthase module [Aspergillus alliaceus]KAB8234043.1 polyketide synthase module [Aspergillus alliaceus]
MAESNRFIQKPIAVLGMACRLPGYSDSPRKLWEFLMRGDIAETEVPKSRFNIKAFYDGSDKPQTLRSPGAMFMESVNPAAFDASFFNISPQDATSMDPQQRILLEVIYEGLENAGLPLEALAGEKYGCFVGGYTGDYRDLLACDPDSQPSNMVVGSSGAMLSNRISHFLDIKGASIPIDTACSSSMVALEMACKMLHTSEIDGAIVAASNLVLHPGYGCDSGPIKNTHSPTGRCHTFDAKADGYIKAEGINAVILKRLDDAIQDGDPIRAVIRGTASNHNGRTAGIASPSAEAQAAAIRMAYSNANITDYSLTEYLECHGTGTLAGDPVEASGISSVFAASRPFDKPLHIGSIKSNIGHSETASGLSGLIKAIMILETGHIPGNPTFETPNPNIDFQALRLKVQKNATLFPNRPFRRVGVNNFGFGGSNSHVILEEPKALIDRYRPMHTSSYDLPAENSVSGEGHHCNQFYILCFSANDEKSLKDYIKRISQHFCDPNVHVRLRDVAYTLNVRRSQLFHRGYLITKQSHNLNFESVVRGKKSICPPKVGFVFTRQGAQWPEMGRELLKAFPVARMCIKRLDAVLRGLPDPPSWSLYDELIQPRTPEHTRKPEISQPLVTALQIALIGVLRSWGISPRGVVGHSSGEIAASYAAGYLNAAEAMIIAYHRGLAAREGQPNDSAPLGMLAVGLGADKALPYISKLEDVQIACYNSPTSVTLSGVASALEQLKVTLSKDGIFARMLQVDLVYHSTYMHNISDLYERLLRRDLPSQSRQFPASNSVATFSSVTMFSSVTGCRQKTPPDIMYWKTNMTSPVRFEEAMRTMLSTKDSVDFLIEIGPNGALKGPISQIQSKLNGAASSAMYYAAMHRGAASIHSTLAIAGELFLAGFPIDLEKVNGDTELSRPLIVTDLPNYCWNHTTQYWYESQTSRDSRFKPFIHHDLIGNKIIGTPWSNPTFKKTLKLAHLPWLRDHKIGSDVVFPASGYIAMAVEAIYQISCMQQPDIAATSSHELGYRLRNIRFDMALVLNDEVDSVVYLMMNPSGANRTWYEFTVSSSRENLSTAHDSGMIRLQEPVIEYASEADIAPLQHPSPGHLWTKACAEVGYNYGPAFHILEQVELSEVLIPAMVDDMVINPNQARPRVGMAVASSYYSGRGREDVAKSYVGDNSVYDPASGALLVRMTGLSNHQIDLGIDPLSQHTLTQDIIKPDISTLSQESVDKLSISHIEMVPFLLELAVHKKPSMKILEVDLDSDGQQSLWLEFLQVAGATHQQYRFRVLDEVRMADIKGLYNDNTNCSFGVLDCEDSRLGFAEDIFDLVILRAISPLTTQSSLVVDAVMNLVSRDGHILAIDCSAPAVDRGHLLTSKIKECAFAKFLSVPHQHSKILLCSLPGTLPAVDKELHIVYFKETTHFPLTARQYLEQEGWNVIEHRCSSEHVPEGATVLIIDEFFAPVLAHVSKLQWLCLRQLVTRSCKLLWVTQGGQMSVSKPDNALVVGLFRSIRSEDPSATVMTLDMHSLNDSTLVHCIATVLRQVRRSQDRHVSDNKYVEDSEYVEYNGILHVHRIVPHCPLNQEVGSWMKEPIRKCLPTNGAMTQLRAEKIGTLDGLHFAEVSKEPPAEGQVEIEVKAAGLNFKDVAVTMGIVPENEYLLGLEGSGIIRRVSDADPSIINTRVAFMAKGAMANRIHVPLEFTHAIPDSMTYDEAATMPVVFCTALYSLFNMGNLRRGQTVLIHSATGGVGIACIQLAQYIGADIYVTVGTEEKCLFLHKTFGIPYEHMFSSRCSRFAAEIMKATGGRGINVVVNSLTGDLLDATWRICADGGTMVELGKRDIVQRNYLSMEPFNRGCSFRAVDLSHGDLLQEVPGLLKRIFVLQAENHIKPIAPVTAFPMTRVPEAFAYMRSGRHIGKIVIHQEVETAETEQTVPIRPLRKELSFHDGVAYLIVGGLKGLCGSLAMHLAHRGVRHLVVMSRSGCYDSRSQTVMAYCQSFGCEVHVCRGDVSRIPDVRRAFIAAPVPIRGVVQGVMALYDRPYEVMTLEEYHQSIEGKVQGTWNLHHVSVENRRRLDFFLLLSSISSIVGSPGQANYSAANSFLDSFTAYRRSMGLAAQTVNLGVVEDVGVVAESQELSQRHQASNELVSIPERVLHCILDYSLRQQYLHTTPTLASNYPDRSYPSHLIIGLIVPQDPTKSNLRFDPRFQGLFIANDVSNPEAGGKGTDDIGTAVQSFRARVGSGVAAEELLGLCLQILAARLMQMLRRSAEQRIEPGQPLSVYGLDSLSTVELRNWIKAEMGATLTTFDILNASSLIMLGERLVNKLHANR